MRPLRAACLLLAILPAGGCGAGLHEVTRVVVVTFDTTRADHLGCYGDAAAETPNLDAFASDAVLFEQAVSSVPTTLPSHSTMFTGYYPLVHGVRYNIVFRLGGEARTLAELLGEAGYESVALPASYVVGRRFGIDQGFGTFHDPPAPDMSTGPKERSAAEGVDLALEWIAEHQGRRSFVWLHFYEPHHPYAPPFPFSARFRDHPYDGEIAYADAQFGRLIDALRADADWPHTLVLVAGDHGEGLHEHGESFHANLVYESTQHVPLIIRAPGGRSGRVAEPVALVDVTPTVLDLVGSRVPEGLQGISLRPALTGGQLPTRDLYFESLAGALNYGWAELKGLRRGSWKLIDSTDPELFDLENDPAELTNLAALEPERLQDLRAALARLEEQSAAAGETVAEQAQDPIPDAQTEQFLASLGYVGGGAGGSASENAPNPRSMIQMDGELRRARAAVLGRDWASVERIARYVLDRDPSNKWALNNMAATLLRLEKPEEAQEFAAEQVRLYPDAPEGYAMLARAHRARKDYEGAVKVLEHANQVIDGSEWLTYLLLVASFDAGRDDVCDQVIAKIELFPSSPRLYVLKARCFARQGDLAAAAGWLGNAVNLGFDDLELLEEAEDFGEVVKMPEFRLLLLEQQSREGKPATGRSENRTDPGG